MARRTYGNSDHWLHQGGWWFGERVVVDGRSIQPADLQHSHGLLVVDARTGDALYLTPPGWSEDAGVALMWGEITPATPDIPDVSDSVLARVPGLVAEAYARVRWPPITLGIAPQGTGLVGLPSLYWVEGYGGEPRRARSETEIEPEVGPDVPDRPVVDGRSVPRWVPADCPCRRPRTLAVEVTVHSARLYRWAFGDGSGAEVTSRGAYYAPGATRSDIQHQYEWSSRAHPAGYPVTLDVLLPVSYAVTFEGDTRSFDLGATTIRYGRSYPVQELQSVLLAPDARFPR